MKCEDAERLMIDYLDENLDDENRMAMEAHLSSCEKCLDDVMELKDLFSGMRSRGNAEPGESLRINFYHMLHGEIRKNKLTGDDEGKTLGKGLLGRRWYGIAAGVAILITGTFMGIMIESGINRASAGREVSQLRTEISSLREATMMTMLKQQSSSDRIQALGYVNELENPDQDVIGVLVKTLNTDRNLNVRMAAAYTLAKYSDQRPVCDSLVKSLAIQTEPIIQITLINILAERKVKSAFIPIQRIIENKGTLKEVRTAAQNSLHQLI